jgi:hypothetical protein
MSCQPRYNQGVRLLFNIFLFLSALTTLLFVGSVGLETVSGRLNIQLSGTELTIGNFSGIDRILLGAWLISLMFTAYFWSRIPKGR